MIAYLTIDDQNGILFNHRRQCQDRGQRANLLKDCADRTLWVSEYSADLFRDEEGRLPDHLVADNDLFSKADATDACFLEDLPLLDHLSQIDTLVLYKWNCAYPADTFLDTSFLKEGWKKFSLNHFKGSSHTKIFKEVWVRTKA